MQPLEVIDRFSNAADNHRLVHELMVQQIELIVQNEELIATKAQAINALNRGFELNLCSKKTSPKVTYSAKV